jgi:hypothetical protein
MTSTRLLGERTKIKLHVRIDHLDVVVGRRRASFCDPRNEKNAGNRRVLAEMNKKLSASDGLVALSSDGDSSKRKK